MAQLLRPVLFVHRGDEQASVSSVDAEAVVNHAGAVVLNHRAEKLYAAASRFDFKSVRPALRRFDFVKAGSLGIAAGRDGLPALAVDADVELAAARLLQVVDFHAREVLARLARARGRKARILAGAAGAETDAAQTELARVARRPHRVVVPAAARRERDGVVAIPSPGSVHQDEAVSGIAKACLHQAANGAGDAVVGNRRIAVVRDARNRARLFGIRAGERCVEGIESFSGVFNRMLGADDDGRVCSGRREGFFDGRRAAARNAAVGRAAALEGNEFARVGQHVAVRLVFHAEHGSPGFGIKSGKEAKMKTKRMVCAGLINRMWRGRFCFSTGESIVGMAGAGELTTRAGDSTVGASLEGESTVGTSSSSL